MSAELIERSVVERHRELTAALANGVNEMCRALWNIRLERSYRAEGCKSFGEFLRRAGISESTGRLYANCGPALNVLVRSGHGELVKHVEVLKPIHLMIAKAVRENNAQDVERVASTQARIVVIAAEVAKRGQEPLTASVIERVAEANFRWLPARKRKAMRDAQPEPEQKFEHPWRKEARELIAIANVKIAGMNADNAVRYAYVHRLPGFMDLAQWFADVVAEAAVFDRNTPDLWS